MKDDKKLYSMKNKKNPKKTTELNGLFVIVDFFSHTTPMLNALHPFCWELIRISCKFIKIGRLPPFPTDPL